MTKRMGLDHGEKSPLNLKKLLRYALQGVAMGVVATVGVFLFTLSSETLVRLRSFPWRYLPLLFALVCFSWILSGSRIWLLARSLGFPLSLRQAITIVLCTEFGIAASPGGMGGALIMMSLLRAEGIPWTTSGSILAADVGVDGLFFLLLVPVAVIVILKEPGWGDLFQGMGSLYLTLLGFLAAVVLLLAAGLYYRKRLGRIGRQIANTSLSRKYRFSARVRYVRLRTKRNLRRSWEVICFLYRYRRATLMTNFLLSILQWLSRYAVLPVILLAFPSTKNPLTLIFIQAFLFALALILVVPGGGGGIEVLTPFILRHFAPLSLVGVVLVLWRFFTYHLYLLVGGITLFLNSQRLELLFSSNSSTFPDINLKTTKQE
jgi:uncharacterized protein (TIRG00374 family)